MYAMLTIHWHIYTLMKGLGEEVMSGYARQERRYLCKLRTVHTLTVNHASRRDLHVVRLVA